MPWPILTLTVIAIAALALGWWLWRTRPWRGPRSRYPIVLVHGIFGFDEIGLGSVRQNYFRGIGEALRRQGNQVHQPRLPLCASIAERARCLAEALSQIPARRVNIIAHSMGGLDARYAITRLGCHRKVAALITIGTPHRGSPIADVGSAILGEGLGLGTLLRAVGLDLGAVHDLTGKALEAFNREVPDARGIAYASVVAAVGEERAAVHPVLKTSLKLLDRHGPSDGVVPEASQPWGEVLRRIRADHWAQIGWSGGFEPAPLYLDLVTWLRKKGR